jgi:hypothetical protein
MPERPDFCRTLSRVVAIWLAADRHPTAANNSPHPLILSLSKDARLACPARGEKFTQIKCRAHPSTGSG